MTRAAVLACSLAAAALLSFRPIYEPDLWWHLAQGRENAAGHLVRTNLFSFTYPDYRQPYNSWLFDLACYLAWQALGATGIQVLQAVFITLTLADAVRRLPHRARRPGARRRSSPSACS